MSRKGKHHKAPNTAAASGAALADQAEAALCASRFKEAIELYKSLLKREHRADWLNGLAAAYAGRADQLAAKGMVKEALALWRTRADICGTPVFDGPYVGWLVQSGDSEQTLRLLGGSAAPSSEARAQLEMRLAAVALVAPDGALAGLAADSPLLRHRAAAQAALAACARGDDGTMSEHLQTIPFRSPYRDLKAVLKALAACAVDTEQAAALLARVPPGGPFEPIAAALRACLLPGTQWFGALHGLDEQARALVLDVKGCPEEQRALVLDLAIPKEASSAAAALYDVLARHRRALPEGAAARFCRRLLPHAPQRLSAYSASFEPLAAAERDRIFALAAELTRRTDEAEDHWLRVAEAYKAEPAGHSRAAHVLRHLADDLHHCARDGNACDDVLDWWAQIIELDPEDRATHLKLIRTLRSRSDFKATRARLDAALGHFPDDADVLLEAVETALASGAFKKAAGIAKRVLELDPINPRVRSVIGHAHLAHARKQVESRKLEAARREIEEAEQWLRVPSDRACAKLLRGIIEERAELGDVLLREGLAELGGGVAASFQLLLEAGRTKGDGKALLGRAGVDPVATPQANEVVALAHALNAARDGEKAIRAALGPLRPMLERAAAMTFEEPDHILVCETLHRRNERELTRRYAEAALKRWPRRPVFVYLRAAAIYGGNPWQIPPRELRALEQALDQAQAQGEQRTALRLRDLLTNAMGGLGPPDVDMDHELDELAGDDPRSMLEIILAMGGEEQFLDIARRQLGKQMFEELRRELGGNRKQFARALLDLLGSVALGGDPAVPGVPAPPAAPPPRKPKPPQPGQKDLFDE
jgi:tetratricopeptide (TPR) repeat protein